MVIGRIPGFSEREREREEGDDEWWRMRERESGDEKKTREREKKGYWFSRFLDPDEGRALARVSLVRSAIRIEFDSGKKAMSGAMEWGLSEVSVRGR